jgi:RNA polymerase sigma factor (sigma-70 family)
MTAAFQAKLATFKNAYYARPAMSLDKPLHGRPAIATLPADSEHLSVEQAFRRYHANLMHFLRGRLHNEEDAADIAQETYARLLQSYRDVIDVETARTLMFRIAVNAANDLGRRRRSHFASEHGPIDEGMPLAAGAPSQEREVAGQQDLNVLFAAIESLPPKCQQVFLLNRIDCMTYPQIASHCGISVKMVEKHIVKALAALRARVGGAA